MLLLPKMIKAAKVAGTYLAESFGKGESAEIGTGFSGDKTLVADKIAEEACVGILEDLDCEINSEELGKIEFGEPKYRFWIDPLDGSENFSRGLYPWAISIFAESMTEEPLVGVVYDPVRDQCFYAEKGRGAFMNNQSIKPRIRPMENCIFGMFMKSGNPHPMIPQGFNLLYPKLKSILRFGSTAIELCWVASGKLDGYVHFPPTSRPYDYLAALLILSEAGVIVTDPMGNPLPKQNSSVVAASNRDLHQKVLGLISPLYRS